MVTTHVELTPIKETKEDYDRLELKLKEFFRREIYYPILLELRKPRSTLTNSSDALHDAIQSGRVTFSQGRFRGEFSSRISADLRQLGAVWDRSSRSYVIRLRELPVEIRGAISASFARYKEKMASIDEKLAKILPEEITSRLNTESIFDSTIFKTDRNLKATMKAITVSPELTPEARKRIAKEWQTNMDLWVKDFTKKEIVSLRESMQRSVFAGNRYESAVKSIQDSYQVSANKAKFLARQETGLLVAKFTETQYVESGVDSYKWGCVAGSKNHPVRPAHKSLEGKIFKWNNPPITTGPGEPVRRNNPKQDFNCRCFAIPIVTFNRFRSKK